MIYICVQCIAQHNQERYVWFRPVTDEESHRSGYDESCAGVSSRHNSGRHFLVIGSSHKFIISDCTAPEVIPTCFCFTICIFVVANR